MDNHKKDIWNGLAVVICSHLSSNRGIERSRYMRYLIQSILDGEVLPEKLLSLIVNQHTTSLSGIEISNRWYPIFSILI